MRTFRALAAGLALLAFAAPLRAAEEAVVPAVDVARSAAITAMQASFSAGFPEVSDIHPFISQFGTLDAAHQQYLIERTIDALADKGVPLATLAAIAPKSAEAKLMLGQAAKAVEKEIRDEASDVDPNSEKVLKMLRSPKEKELRELGENIGEFFPLYKLVASKSSAKGMQELFETATNTAEAERVKRIEREETWDAEALLPGFAPGFHKEEGFAVGEKNLETVKPLLAQLGRNTSSSRYDQKLTKRIVAAAKQGATPVRAFAIQGLMDNAYSEPRRSKAFVKNAVEGVSEIASVSYSPRVRALAIALLSRQDGFKPKKMLEKIAKLAHFNERAVTQLPVVDAARVALPAEKVSLLDQAKEGVKGNRIAAALAGLKIGSMLLPLVHIAAINPLPLIGLLAAIGVMGYVAVKGLYTHHPVATVAQLLLIGSMFKHFRIWAHEPAIVVAVLMLGVLAQAYVALVSYKKDQTVIGWIVSRGLTWPAAAAAVALFHLLS